MYRIIVVLIVILILILMLVLIAMDHGRYWYSWTHTYIQSLIWWWYCD